MMHSVEDLLGFAKGAVHETALMKFWHAVIH